MTNVRSTSVDVQPSAFLDSNILVRLFHFWDACESLDIRLDAASNWEELKAELEDSGVPTGILNRADAEYVKLGMASFQRLKVSSSGCLFFTSRFCWSEAHHVLLEDRGLERLVRLGIPFSFRVKRPQALYRISLEKNDYVDLDDRLETFRYNLQMDYGIKVINVEDSFAAELEINVWAIAQAVWSLVLISVIDAYVYAASIMIGADVFITSDTSLRGAIEQFHKPDSDWMALVTSLKQELEMEPDAKFPQPLSPTGDLPSVQSET